jgi:membrane-associated phospholipid phosphatase
MLKKIILLFLIGVSFQSSLFAQVDAADKQVDTVKKIDVAPETQLEKKQEKKLYSFRQFGHETYLFVIHPTKWKGIDWLKLGAVTAGTLAIMPLDGTMKGMTQGEQRFYYNPAVVGGRVYGEWYSIAGVAAVFYTYGWIAKDTTAKKITIELLQAGIYAELVTTMLKIAIGRARPYQSESPFTFKPFTFLDDAFHSLPSGHATSAMALSTVMSRHAPTTFLKILAYVPAGFTLFSRIYQDKHWMSDEFLGAAIGYFVGNWVVDLHEGKRHRINVTALYPTTTVTYSLNQIKTKKMILLKAGIQ